MFPIKKNFIPKLKQAGSSFSRFILPPRCLACESLTANQGGLCTNCFKKMAFITRPFNDKTGDPLPYEDAIDDVHLQDKTAYRKMRAACLYEETARRLITSLKYKDRLDLAQHMARLMFLNGQDLLKQADIIIPVPLYKKRLTKRRFNQAGELARHLALQSNCHFHPDILKRIRSTKQQTRLSMHERLKNVEGAFHINPEKRQAIKGRKIILVDDVVTTGATIEACCRALLRDNPCYIDVLCFAKVVDYAKGPT